MPIGSPLGTATQPCPAANSGSSARRRWPPCPLRSRRISCRPPCDRDEFRAAITAFAAFAARRPAAASAAATGVGVAGVSIPSAVGEMPAPPGKAKVSVAPSGTAGGPHEVDRRQLRCPSECRRPGCAGQDRGAGRKVGVPLRTPGPGHLFVGHGSTRRTDGMGAVTAVQVARQGR